MIDAAIAWLLAHPLEGACGLCVMSVVIGLVLVPSLHDVARHGPPRC